jgi:DNA-directed RNA polymerase specialized sigma24 family protein
VLPDETTTDAFTEFVAAVEARLRYALTAALGSQYGREAAAEALAFGWEHWDRVEVMGNPAGYLYRVGLNHGKKLKQDHRVVLPEAPLQKLPWVEPGLPAALAGLPERQRVTVLLVYGHEWSMGEVAELLGISKGSVQTHVGRALKKLRGRLGVKV